MAYSTPRTWTTGDEVTAAMLNQNIRDNVSAIAAVTVDGVAGAWTAFTPTLTQSATVTKTVTYARYVKIGRLVVAQIDLAITGTGTASNNVTVGVPVTAAQSALEIGGGLLYDSSADAAYKFTAELSTTTTLVLRPNSVTTNTFLGSSTFTAALASGDIVRYHVMYEAAS